MHTRNEVQCVGDPEKTTSIWPQISTIPSVRRKYSVFHELPKYSIMAAGRGLLLLGGFLTIFFTSLLFGEGSANAEGTTGVSSETVVHFFVARP